jgi:predicted membrane channel-forming protein YqfA (hemolysin III family)
MSLPEARSSHPFFGRLYLLLGLTLPLLGVAGYVVQTSFERLTAPWYVPGFAVLGVILVVMSLFERRTAWRITALVLVVLLATAEGAVFYLLRLPGYTGPIKVGHPFPTFETVRADGTPFSHRDLYGDRDNVLVFFRGRW